MDGPRLFRPGPLLFADQVYMLFCCCVSSVNSAPEESIAWRFSVQATATEIKSTRKYPTRTSVGRRQARFRAIVFTHQIPCIELRRHPGCQRRRPFQAPYAPTGTSIAFTNSTYSCLFSSYGLRRESRLAHPGDSACSKQTLIRSHLSPPLPSSLPNHRRQYKM